MASTKNLGLNAGFLCTQYISLFISFISGVTSILLIAIGCIIQAQLYDFEQFLDGNISAPASLFVVIGCILLFVAAFGGYAVIKESCLLINLYGVFLVLILTLEVSTSIAGFVMKNKLREMLKMTMEQSMMDYNEDKGDIQTSMDIMYFALQCCGFNSPNDWRKYMNETGPNMQNGIAVPSSCCWGFTTDYLSNYRECRDQYQVGCAARLDITTSQTAMLIATGVAAVALVQLLGAVCAFLLSKSLRRHKSLRETYRWQLQQNLDASTADGKMNTSINSPVPGYAQLESESTSYAFNTPSVH